MFSTICYVQLAWACIFCTPHRKHILNYKYKKYYVQDKNCYIQSKYLVRIEGRWNSGRAGSLFAFWINSRRIQWNGLVDRMEVGEEIWEDQKWGGSLWLKKEWMQLAQRCTQRGSYLHNTSYKIYDVDIHGNLYGLTHFYNKTKYQISLKWFSQSRTETFGRKDVPPGIQTRYPPC